MRRFAVLLIPLVLGSAVAAQEADVREGTALLEEQELRERWLGRHRDDLIAAWGDPTTTKHRKGAEVLIYKNLFYCGIFVRSSSDTITASGPPATEPEHLLLADHRVADPLPYPQPTGQWDKTKVVFQLDSAGRVEDLRLSLPSRRNRKKCMSIGKDVTTE